MSTPASNVDVSPMVFTEFVSNGRRYRTDRPLVFSVEYLDEDEMYLIEGEFEIALWAPTRDEVWLMLIETMDWMWRHVAEAAPEVLGRVSLEMGSKLRERFMLVTDAAATAPHPTRVRRPDRLSALAGRLRSDDAPRRVHSLIPPRRLSWTYGVRSCVAAAVAPVCPLTCRLIALM